MRANNIWNFGLKPLQQLTRAEDDFLLKVRHVSLLELSELPLLNDVDESLHDGHQGTVRARIFVVSKLYSLACEEHGDEKVWEDEIGVEATESHRVITEVEVILKAHS